jgi:hypothetical protein
MTIEEINKELECYKNYFEEKSFSLEDVRAEVEDFLSNNKDMIVESIMVNDMIVDFEDDLLVVNLITHASVEVVFNALENHRERWYHKHEDLDRSCLNVLAI